MTKTTKILLTVSILSLAVGFTGPGSEILQGGLKPLGAVAFILFFISNLLAKEMARFDQEQPTVKSVTGVNPQRQVRTSQVQQHA
ncbi:MAG TPA: hypothetical protein VMZ27_10140 [Candidatus Saccharimonadales bacterium]|nr:hypothetical protein [Candidatus Saccharimonadales bacterium]